jgi:hypothetical protein
MITYSFFIKTNGHIDKLKIKFENNSLCKKFVKYIKNNISNKYDFFLYS